jgi:hypothetical protein
MGRTPSLCFLACKLKIKSRDAVEFRAAGEGGAEDLQIGGPTHVYDPLRQAAPVDGGGTVAEFARALCMLYIPLYHSVSA